MGAKAILKRYLVRNREHSPVEPLELREHLASVAERSGLKVTGAELDEILETGVRRPEKGEGRPETRDQKTENGDGKPKAGKKGKTARNKKAAPKSGDSTKTKI